MSEVTSRNDLAPRPRDQPSQNPDAHADSEEVHRAVGEVLEITDFITHNYSPDP